MNDRYTVEEAVEAVRAMEERHDLLRHTVDGWAAWPVLRFEIAQLLFAPSSQISARIGRRTARFRYAMSDFLALLRLRGYRSVVSTFTSALVDDGEGMYSDIYFDDLMPILGNTFRLETLNNVGLTSRRAKSRYRSDMTTSLIDVAAGVMTRRRSSGEVRAAATAISSAVRNELAGRVTPEWVELRLRYFTCAEKLWASLLRKIRPEVMLIADQSQYALVAGARRAGVPVVELQHGITDGSNAVYSWSAYGLPYRRSMPLPDRIFLYGEYWRVRLAVNGFWGDALRVTGSPRLDRFRSRAAQRDARLIVFTAQGVESDRAAQWLNAALAGTDDTFRLFIRLHPVYGKDRDIFLRTFANNPKVRVLSADQSPSTFETLSRAGLHVSISSASHYDAIGLGVPTVILPLALHEAVLPLHRNGHATLARSPEHLAELFRNGASLKVSEDARTHYFASGSLERFRQALGEVIAASKNGHSPAAA